MKNSEVIFVEDSLEEAFNYLSDKDPLRKSLERAIKTIQENCYCGRQVKKNLIPKQFIERYNINNLWIYNLPDSWRLLYALTPGGELEIIAALLDWMNHKDYERLFKF
jgi:hypothetical protein